MVPRSLARVAGRLVGGVALVWLTGAAEPQAISCSSVVVTGGDICRQYPQSAVVFSGSVLELLLDGRYRMRVDRAWRGVTAGSHVVVHPASIGPCAQHRLTPGPSRFIVFADRAKDGGITLSHDGIYSWEVGSEEGAEAVRFMDSLDRPARTGTIDGAVTVWTAGMTENRPFSVKGAAVIADGNRTRVTATTDQHGEYELTGLSPGRYRVRVEMPPGLPSAYAQRPESAGQEFKAGAGDKTRLAVLVDIPRPRACVLTWFTGAFEGEIAGTVLHADGSPAGDIFVRVRPVPGDRRPEHVEEVWVKTDAGGQFRVTALSPWAYQVGATFDHVVTDAAPFGLSMYGGSPNASPISLSMSQALDLGILRLPPRVEKRQIHGRVESPGPAGGSIRVSAEDSGSLVRLAEVRPDGTFTLELFEGRTYRIQVTHFEWPLHQMATRGIPRRLGIGTLEITVHGDSTGLRIPLRLLDR
jgi:hypothetical protein